jgi:hypothetical protein
MLAAWNEKSLLSMDGKAEKRYPLCLIAAWCSSVRIASTAVMRKWHAAICTAMRNQQTPAARDRSLMDKIADSDSVDRGSIPFGRTTRIQSGFRSPKPASSRSSIKKSARRR